MQQTSSPTEVLNHAQVLTVKIGGGNAPKLRETEATVRRLRELGKKVILAISALRSGDRKYNNRRDAEAAARDKDSDGNVKNGFNVTSHLIQIGELLQHGDRTRARELAEMIRDFTLERVAEEVNGDDSIPEKEPVQQRLDAVIHEVIDELLAIIDGADQYDLIPNLGDERLLRQRESGNYYSLNRVGEHLARRLYMEWFSIKQIQSAELRDEGLMEQAYGDDAEAVCASPKESDRAVGAVREAFRSQIEALLPGNDILVSGGHTPVNCQDRGYSESTGADEAIAATQAGYNAVNVVLQDEPFLSSDPRKGISRDRLQVLHEMTYALAKEHCGDRGPASGVIQPPALDKLDVHGIPTVVFNPAKPIRDENMTLIHNYAPAEGPVLIVDSRKVSVAVTVTTTGMVGEPGFESGVTTWFAQRGISIDLMFPSNQAVTYTFNNGVSAADMNDFRGFIQKFSREGREIHVNVIEDASLVFCLGNRMRMWDLMQRAGRALEDAHMEDEPYGQVQSNAMFSGFLVHTGDAPKLADKLHAYCVEQADTPAREIAA